MNLLSVKTLMFIVPLVGLSSLATAHDVIEVPCQYLKDGAGKLEWEERSKKENRFQFFMSMQNREGQTGQCNWRHGQPDSCGRVSWMARVITKRELIGWVYPDRAQAVYHFEGGIKPDDFCEIN